MAFSLVFSDTRRWLDKHLEAHFLTLLEIFRNFLARSKYLKGFISDLQLQCSFSLLPLLFSTLKAFSQRHQLFGDEGEAKLLSLVWQHCSGGHAVPRALWEGSRPVSQQAEILHSMAQQLPLSWDAPRVSYTG